MMLFNQISYDTYWERILECPKNNFAEIPITFLELKILKNIKKFQSFEELHDLLLFRITAIKYVKLNFLILSPNKI
jgi:hypothetical protein